ncbi:MCE family protein [Spongiactinospora sp. TRM90649]|uniref:MCE family protein n=1 Tax=Spongiactinospora sp. TRM90649 TaxID=3031114 RepID=UPI0023F8FB86|nr:MCE family protein [Spongiactinospora sp. TRM90649]MDF5755908.1 MCE family protein [Spongiactinospora sp. TRM90649]
MTTPRGAAALAVAVVVSLAACSADALRTLGAPTGSLTLHATFDDAQSLVPGHGVQIADVRVGSVTRIGLSGHRARVTMSVRNGHRVPLGTTASVAKTSVLGENYVRLIPPRGADLVRGPFLANGATIGKTSVEPGIEQVTERAGPLIDALGAQDVNAILDATATGLGGRGGELNRLIERTASVGAAYAAARGDIARAVDGLAALGHDLAGGRAELDGLPGRLRRATHRLVHGRRHVKTSLAALTALAREVNATIHPRHAERLRRLLTDLDAVATAALRGKEDLKELAARVQVFLDQPPIVANGQLLIYVWLRGLILPLGGGRRGEKRRESFADDYRLIVEPPG